MIVRFPGIDKEFDCGNASYINSIVIESPRLLVSVLSDVNSQLNGNDGKTTVYDMGKSLSVDKYMELHSVFVPFSMNQKGLINKIVSRLIELSHEPDHYLRSADLLSEFERFFMTMSIEIPGNIEFTKLSMEALIKASGPSVSEEYATLSEQLLDYFELVREYERDKVFVLVNLRGYLATDELKVFLNEVLAREYQVILLDTCEYPLLESEKRFLVDDSLCEIS